MPKVILNDLANLNTPLSQINENFRLIEEAFENTVSRDGSTPNAMGANHDMNGNRILNVGAPSAAGDAARFGDIGEAVAASEEAAADALATAADRVQTGLDRVATGEDRVQTGLDRVAVASIEIMRVDTIDDLRVSDITLNKSIQPLGYHTIGDGGGGPVRIGKVAPAGGLTDNGGSIIKPFGAVGDAIASGSLYWGWEWSGTVIISWFGTVGDGVADDTVPIQSAINTLFDIHCSQGVYRITSTLVMLQAGQTLTGPSGSIAPEFGSFGATFKLDIEDADPATAILMVRGDQNTVSNITFLGDTGNTSDVAIIFEKNNGNNDDFDGYVVNCAFHYFDVGVHAYGRALYASRNVFNSSNRGIILDWPASGTAGPSIQVDDLYKGRAHRIVDNRFHGGTAVTVQNFWMRGGLIANNSVDIGNRLLLVTGGADTGLIGTDISHNIADLCSLSSIKFEEGTLCVDVTIHGGKLGGAIAGEIVDTGDKRPFAAIQFDSVSEIKGLSITDMTITGTDAYAISFQNDQSAAAIIPTQVSITNVIFREIGLDGIAVRRIVNSVYSLTDFIFNNNIISDAGTTVTSILNFSSKTLTNSDIRANIYDIALPLFGDTPTFAGTTTIEQKQGGYRINSAGQFELGNSGGYTSIIPQKLTRLGSTGGVGIQYSNDAGYVQVAGRATGINAGYFEPGVDNSIASGSTVNRWSVIYSATGTINTSDENLKQDIEHLGEAERRVASALKGLIKKYRFKEAVEKKVDTAPVHVGIIAQEVKKAFEDEGLDPEIYGMLSYDEWSAEPAEYDEFGVMIRPALEGGGRYGIRYDELLCFILATV